MEFQDQLRKNQEQREALDKMQIEDEFLSSESDEAIESKTFVELVLDHIQTSALLIFPQSSRFRQFCQLLVQSEDDQENQKKQSSDQNQEQNMT